MTTTPSTLDLAGVGPVDVTIDENGEGKPNLVLHGGGGPDTTAGFAVLLATGREVRVINAIHPGFGGSPRPEALDTIRGLAALSVALLDQLELNDVTVIGNSIGGWIGAEVGLLGSPRVTGVVLVDAVGIEVPGHPVADFFSLTMDQVFDLSFHNPEPFRIDPSTLPPAALAVVAGNRATLATYAGTAMADPTLIRRLASTKVPTLVVWGDGDQIADPDYGRAYAAAMPTARFELLEDTGHMPQIETPDQLLRAIWHWAETGLSGPTH